LEGRLKKHEHTRQEKEDENVATIRSTELNSNPVFLAYRPVKDIDQLISGITESKKPDLRFPF
jgi:uncharacterized protein (DUF1015 family)